MITVPDVLDASQVESVRRTIDAAQWEDGNRTSGPQAALAKNNLQLPEDSAAARDAGAVVLEALGRCPLFIAAALPLKIYPPMFNLYSGGQAFGTHIDNAIRIRRGSEFRLRSDLSATLFLSDPDSYDGGELEIDDNLGALSLKLPAGHLALYPASSLHRVSPVTRGARVASFFWIESMVRDGNARAMLFDLDRTIQALAQTQGQDSEHIIRLTGLYHNLLRRWATT